MRLSKLLAALAVLFSTIPLSAQEPIQGYEAPTRLDMETPRYPDDLARVGAEGWVMLNFMVDTEGKPFEPTVVGSAGAEGFQEEAIEALEDSRFHPASINGQPVEGSSFMMYRFALQDTVYKAVTLPFQNRHGKLIEALANDQEEEAEELINAMNEAGGHNNYESALLAMANYSYGSKYGASDEELIQHLEQALNYESYPQVYASEGYLSEEASNGARYNLFLLQVNSRRYAEALASYYKMRELGMDVTPFNSTVEQIHQLRNSDQVYAINGTTDENGLWNMQLFKQGMLIENNSGKLDEFRLRCSSKYQLFPFVPDQQYLIPENWGNCTLEVLGAADVDFQVVQFSASEQ